MTIGMLKNALKNIISIKVFYKRDKSIIKMNKRKKNLLKCLLMNLLHHSLEDLLFRLMDSYLFYLVEFIKATIMMILNVVLIYSERIISQNHRLLYRPINNLF
jgi:hypothetical protein